MIRLGDLFDIEYGRSKFNKNNLSVDGITPLVSSTGNNNGVWGYGNLEPEYKNVISVPRTGSICEAHYQGIDCCINSDCLVLTPKKEYTEKQMIYFAFLIRQEKYKYTYGRKVTPSRLGETQIPDEIPSWIYEIEIPDYSNVTKPYLDEPTPALNVEEWKEFRLDELFDISASKNISNKEASGNPGDMPYITTTGDNNGVQQYTSIGPFYDGKCLTVAGSGTIFATFYQDKPFTTSQRLYVLKPLFKINSYIAMFLIPLIEQEGYRFSYGRQVKIGHVRDMVIKLPATPEGNPDWEWMEKYVKTLGWSREV